MEEDCGDMEAHNKRTEYQIKEMQSDIEAGKQKVKRDEIAQELARVKKLAYHG